MWGSERLRIDKDLAARGIEDASAAGDAPDIDPIVGVVRADDEAVAARGSSDGVARFGERLWALAIIIAFAVNAFAILLDGFSDEIATGGSDGGACEGLVAAAVEGATDGGTGGGTEEGILSGGFATGEGDGEEREE